MRLLFLDDMRPAPAGWTLVKSYAEFISHIETLGVPDAISFDHDLGFEHYPLGEQNLTERIPYEAYTEKTGYHCAQWLVEKNLFPKMVMVHSFNIVGAANIANLLRRYVSVYVRPYKMPYPEVK